MPSIGLPITFHSESKPVHVAHKLAHQPGVLPASPTQGRILATGSTSCAPKLEIFRSLPPNDQLLSLGAVACLHNLLGIFRPMFDSTSCGCPHHQSFSTSSTANMAEVLLPSQRVNATPCALVDAFVKSNGFMQLIQATSSSRTMIAVFDSMDVFQHSPNFDNIYFWSSRTEDEMRHRHCAMAETLPHSRLEKSYAFFYRTQANSSCVLAITNDIGWRGQYFHNIYAYFRNPYTFQVVFTLFLAVPTSLEAPMSLTLPRQESYFTLPQLDDLFSSLDTNMMTYPSPRR
jgi:hypothetical protein